jgi:hypothetical protein
MTTFKGFAGELDILPPTYETEINVAEKHLVVHAIPWKTHEGVPVALFRDKVTAFTGTFGTLRMLSEQLRNEVGVAYAVRFLEHADAFEYPVLWSLGDKRWDHAKEVLVWESRFYCSPDRWKYGQREGTPHFTFSKE